MVCTVIVDEDDVIREGPTIAGWSLKNNKLKIQI
jgi:hypothetical protein